MLTPSAYFYYQRQSAHISVNQRLVNQRQSASLLLRPDDLVNQTVLFRLRRGEVEVAVGVSFNAVQFLAGVLRGDFNPNGLPVKS